MTMNVNALPNWIESEFEFPLTKKTLLARAGDIEIDAPDHANSETIATILEVDGSDTYQSREDLVTAIRGNLGDAYIGRKYYDDRGSNPIELERNTQRTSTNKSF